MGAPSLSDLQKARAAREDAEGSQSGAWDPADEIGDGYPCATAGMSADAIRELSKKARANAGSVDSPAVPDIE